MTTTENPIDMEGIELPLAFEDAKDRLKNLEAVIMFEKILTSSDCSGTGRIVIPKSVNKRFQSVAEANFAELCDQDGAPIPLTDVFGNSFHFKFRFWINNNSRMYLIENTTPLIKQYRMGVGDVLVIARHPSRAMYVCGRRATEDDRQKKSRRGGSNTDKKGQPRERTREKRKQRDTTATTTPSLPDQGNTIEEKVAGNEGQKHERDEVKPAVPIIVKSKRTQKKAQDQVQNAAKRKRQKSAFDLGASSSAMNGVLSGLEGGKEAQMGRLSEKIPGTSISSALATTTDLMAVLESIQAEQQNEYEDLGAAYTYWTSASSLPPRRDGVFRAVPTHLITVVPNQVFAQHGHWTAVISLYGEPYQAFFDTEEAARCALDVAMQNEVEEGQSGLSPALPTNLQANGAL